MRLNTYVASFMATAGVVLSGTAAMAQEVNQELEVVGAPVPRGTGFQPSATELARDVV